MIKSYTVSSLQKDLGGRSSDCWFKDHYCRSDASNVLQKLSLENSEACQAKCQALDGCLFFTFHKTRGRGQCYLLNQCGIHSRCSSKANCASGRKTCTSTCPKLDFDPKEDPNILHARWSCMDDINPYTTRIPVGTVCSTTCPAWKGPGEKPLSVQSTCLESGKWSQTQPSAGRSLAYAGSGSYATPDQPDMVCGCQDVGPFNYDPNSEDGATFVCRGWEAEQYKKAGGWNITNSDRCDLYCNYGKLLSKVIESFIILILIEPTPFVSVYCEETTWKGEPELGFWCYKKPETPGPQKQKGKLLK